MKVVFLDRDNTLNPDPGYISKPDQISLFDDTVEALRLLQHFDYKLIVVSNQSGIGRGYFTEQDLEIVNTKLKSLLLEQGVTLTDLFHCPHKPEDHCDCRKPSPGLIQKAVAKYPAIDLKQSFIIGDKVSDVELALHLPLKPIQIRSYSDDKSSKLTYPILKNLKAAANYILEDNFNQTWNQNFFYFNQIEELAGKLKEHKKKNQKIIFTNGCFDILHPGHLQYLEQARRLGDALVVGLNSDDSVKRIKGPERPVNNEIDRALMLLNTKAVDYILIFDHSTPEKTIEHIQPNIHVKGGDYQVADLPEAKIVQLYGGEVVILPFRAGYSTTSILKKMR